MRITANQVTFARLIAMPALCWAIYGDRTIQLWAVVLGTIIGATDFVDGWLARKYGPTVLGGLMDPIADKVFIACAFVPYADRGYLPWALIAALFLREYLVTALRSGFERRQRQLKSTYLAKMKTWTQMTTLGLVMIMVAIPSHAIITGVFFGITAVPLLLALTWLVVKRKFWLGAWIGTALHGLFAFFFYTRGVSDALLVLAWTTVILTWVSAFDYVAAAWTVVKEPTLFDLSRLVPAAILPILGMFAMIHGGAPTWTVVTVMALEFAHGGLDNHLAHHNAAAPWWVWSGRLSITLAAFAAAIVWPAYGTWFGALAAAVSLAGTAATFWSRRQYYLESRLREAKRPVAPGTQALTP